MLSGALRVDSSSNVAILSCTASTLAAPAAMVSATRPAVIMPNRPGVVAASLTTLGVRPTRVMAGVVIATVLATV
jgi:hypothetical protein